MLVQQAGAQLEQLQLVKAGLVQLPWPLLAQLGLGGGGLEHGGEGLDLLGGIAHLGVGGGRKRRHLVLLQRWVGQLWQLLLWQALVWRGDGGGQVLDDDGVVEGDEGVGGADVGVVEAGGGDFEVAVEVVG